MKDAEGLVVMALLLAVVAEKGTPTEQKLLSGRVALAVDENLISKYWDDMEDARRAAAALYRMDPTMN